MNKRSRRRLIKDLGGPTRLSRAVTAKLPGKQQVTRQAVQGWINDGFPVERVQVLCEITGMRPAELRPDIFAWTEPEAVQ